MTSLCSLFIAGVQRYARAVLISPLFFASLAACSDAPDPQGAAPQTQAPGPAGFTLSNDALGGYAPARPARGELVAFSQVLAPAGDDGLVSGDVESQTGAALRILDDALATAGLSRADIVHLNVHVVVDEAGRIDAQGVARAWRRNFANAMQPAAPARTLVGVSALPAEGARVSLTALASRPAHDQDESDDAP
jgi:enamine deaminase RidA (YjgF/YER057c/UK114 family)